MVVTHISKRSCLGHSLRNRLEMRILFHQILKSVEISDPFSLESAWPLRNLRRHILPSLRSLYFFDAFLVYLCDSWVDSSKAKHFLTVVLWWGNYFTLWCDGQIGSPKAKRNNQLGKAKSRLLSVAAVSYSPPAYVWEFAKQKKFSGRNYPWFHSRLCSLLKVSSNQFARHYLLNSFWKFKSLLP